jgi:hypothetical protein
MVSPHEPQHPECTTHLITDDPTVHDEFGPHSKVASLLASAILSSPHGSVCVVGEWGSGKSSVVKMMRKDIMDSSPHSVVFVFDAWAHQGDPLRRVFLSSLLELLVGARWVDETLKAGTEKLLAGTEKVTLARQSSVIAPAGLVALGALAIGAVAATALATAAKFAPATEYGWTLGLYLFAAFAPLVFVTTLYLVLKGSSRADGAKAAEDVLGVFISKPPSEVVTTTQEPSQLDSLEFERIFRSLVEGALSSDPAKRIVIVVDNLDRIDPAMARQVWSTLQTFVTCDVPAKEQSSTWLVVPIAESAAETLWAMPAEGREHGRDVSHSMLTKTFQMRVDVPQLVRSDFGGYFAARFADSLPDHLQDAAQVLRVYEVLKPDLVWRTPREVKRFLNELVMLHRQWSHSVPLTAQALYVLARNDRQPIESLVLGDRDYGALTGDPAWRENIAALAYGVPPAIAIQVLLEPQVSAALKSGRAQDVLTFSHVPGFWVTMADAVSDDLREGGLTTVESVIDHYRELISLLTDDQEVPCAPEIFGSIAQALLRCDSWTLNSNHVQPLATVVAGALVPGAVIDGLLKLVRQMDASAVELRTWAAALTGFLKALPEGIRGMAIDGLRLPGTNQIRLSMIESFGTPGRVVPALTLAAGMDALATSAQYASVLKEVGTESGEPFRARVLLGARLVSTRQLLAAIADCTTVRDSDRLGDLAKLWAMAAQALLMDPQQKLPDAIAREGHLGWWAHLALETASAEAQGAVVLMAQTLVEQGSAWQEWPAFGRSQELLTMDAKMLSGEAMYGAGVQLCGPRTRLIRAQTALGPQLLRTAAAACDLDAMSVESVLRIARLGRTPVRDLARMVETLLPRLDLVIRRPFVVVLSHLYLSIARSLKGGAAADRFHSYVLHGLRERYSSGNWTTALTGDTSSATLLSVYRDELSEGVSRSYCEAVVEILTSGGEVARSIGLDLALELARASDREYFDAAVSSALSMPKDDDWRRVGNLIAKIEPSLLTLGFPWNLNSAQLESMIAGLMDTGRFRDAELVIPVISASSVRSRLSAAACKRIRKSVREQLSRRIRAEKRRNALEAVYSLLS